ncbi:LIC_10190 family membrane protein [Crocosphaera chwakensis]|uniref:DUF8201 domain-containing protein n=1 Tax=Crocosphaera chwakensis CCY0110 TaxID=391612 RepID=A3IP50_9CHRO|nr:hypothetical protein [Crocosphaera chwakensis]EAZ91615.1 hypothetical protein CY0110_25828 [Crocosphaera chwakensis CCY0110]
MVYFLLIWLLLACTSYLLGTLILKTCFSQQFRRIGDRFFIALWLGIIILANLLLAISLLVPLSFLTGIIIILGCSFLSILLPSIRQEIRILKSKLSINLFLVILTLSLTVALLTTSQVTWVESKWYHYGAIRWLSEFGVVPGIVLILKNLGITSSWFSLIAPFNGSLVNFRAGALVNSFMLLVMLGHFLLSLWRGIRKQTQLYDWFAISFNGLVLLYLAISDEMQLIVVSLSPDWPIALGIGMTAWTMLLTTNSSQITNNPSIFKQKLSLIPLLLGVGAITIKLSATPLLLVAGIFYIWHERKSLGRLIQGMIFTTILVIPMIVTGLWTSGCPLYPSSLLCLDVPWSLPLQATQQFAAETSSLENWFGEPPTDTIPLFWLISQWITAKNLNLVMMILTVLSLGCLIALSKRLRKSVHGEIWLSGVAILGIIFIFVKGPLIRFGLGYLLILPALSSSIFLNQRFLIKNKELIRLRKSKSICGIRRIILVILGTMMVISLSNPNVLLPSPLSDTRLIKKQVNNVTYFSPVDASCKASVIPCSPQEISDIELRNPGLRIQGGFVKKLSE